MAFATTADLATLLDRAFTTSETLQVDRIMEAATAFIRDEVGAHIAPRLTSTVTVTVPQHEQWIDLPQRPVVSVDTVAVNGSPVDSARWALVDGALYFEAPGWSSRRHSNVTVTFSHGFVSAPEDVRDHCLVIAAQMLAEIEASGSPSSAGIQSRSESIDDHDESVSYETGPGANSTIELPRRVAERLRARYGRSSISSVGAR